MKVIDNVSIRWADFVPSTGRMGGGKEILALKSVLMAKNVHSEGLKT